MGSTGGSCQRGRAGDKLELTLTSTLSPTGVHDQYPQEKRNVESHNLFHLGLPESSLGIHPYSRPHGQRGDNSEHPAKLQVESNLHDPNFRSSSGHRPWEFLLIVIFIPIEGLI